MASLMRPNRCNTNISPAVNPQLGGPDGYHLTSSSGSVIDKALASDGPGDDIDGETRVPSSGMIDMGADEYTAP